MSLYNNFWIRVAKEQNNFTKKEKIIINYIAANSQNMDSMTINELSKANNVGYSVIYNLINKLNFRGYREFVISIAAEENSYKTLNKEIFSSSNALKETYRKLLDLNDLTINRDTMKQFILFLDQNRNSMIYITGIGHSVLGAEDLTFKLYRFGLKAFCFNKDDDNLLMRCSVLRKNDILIIFSLSGKTEIIVKAAQLAKANQAIVVTITGQEKSVLVDYSDWFFTIVSAGMYQEQQIMISPLFSMAYFNDLVVTSILELANNDWYITNRLKTNKVIKKIN